MCQGPAFFVVVVCLFVYCCLIVCCCSFVCCCFFFFSFVVCRLFQIWTTSASVCQGPPFFVIVFFVYCCLFVCCCSRVCCCLLLLFVFFLFVFGFLSFVVCFTYGRLQQVCVKNLPFLWLLFICLFIVVYLCVVVRLCFVVCCCCLFFVVFRLLFVVCFKYGRLQQVCVKGLPVIFCIVFLLLLVLWLVFCCLYVVDKRDVVDGMTRY